MFNKRTFSLFTMLTCILLLGAPVDGTAAETVSVAVLPFEISAGRDLDYVQNGIREILSARLGGEEQVRMLDKDHVDRALGRVTGFTGESRALIAGAALQADYVIYGGITVSNQSVGIEARMADVTGKAPPVTFTDQSPDLNGVIPAINRFATRLAETAFAGKRKDLKTAAGDSGSIRASPEAAEGSADKRLPSKGGAVPESGEGSIPPTAAEPAAREFQTAGPFPFVIQGLAHGDVNNDGKMETVILTDHEVRIYRFENGRFTQIADTGQNDYAHHVGVDAADINGNGIPEIFVTSLSPDRDGAASVVLEYDGKNYVSLMDKAPWYFRVVRIPGQNPLLLGQEQAPDQAELFSRPVFAMAWRSGRYVPADLRIPAGKANVLGAAWGPLRESGVSTAVAFDPGDHLQVLDEAGDILWKTEDPYGGGLAYIAMPNADPTTDRKRVRYFPLRLVFADWDGDGAVEVLTAANQDAARRIFQRFRSLGKGRMVSLGWDGLGLAPQQTTRSLGGRISDFSLGDVDDDGDPELVVALVTKEGDIAFTEARSSLVIYESPSP